MSKFEAIGVSQFYFFVCCLLFVVCLMWMEWSNGSQITENLPSKYVLNTYSMPATIPTTQNTSINTGLCGMKEASKPTYGEDNFRL